MSLSPTDAFAQLNDAMTRMVALDVAMKSEASKEAGYPECAEWDTQADRALEAWTALVTRGVIADVDEIITATYAGKI